MIEAVIAFVTSDTGVKLILGLITWLVARFGAGEAVQHRVNAVAFDAVKAAEQLRKAQGLTTEQAKLEAVKAISAAVPAEFRAIVPIASKRIIDMAIESAVSDLPKFNKPALTGLSGGKVSRKKKPLVSKEEMSAVTGG
jgi:hypothetical protein